MTQTDAESFAREWVDAWNCHDLDAILGHYAEGVEFTSPFVTPLLGDTGGTIYGREALREYFARALAAYPDLSFELSQIQAGLDTLVISYQSVLDLSAAEVIRLDAGGQADRVWCHYTKAPTIRVGYCVTELVQSPDGFVPRLPDRTAYLELGSTGGQRRYGLYSIKASFLQEQMRAFGITPVSAHLEDLLTAAEQYPPAMALMRHATGRQADIHPADFLESVTSSLERHLAVQPHQRYFLAKAVKTQVGYKYAGSYYWIVGLRSGHHGVPKVDWVSTDFFIYQGDVTDFDMTLDLLNERFPRNPE